MQVMLNNIGFSIQSVASFLQNRLSRDKPIELTVRVNQFFDSNQDSLSNEIAVETELGSKIEILLKDNSKTETKNKNCTDIRRVLRSVLNRRR